MSWAFDFGYCLKENIGSEGIAREDIKRIEGRLKSALAKIEEGRKKGEPGFLTLPSMTAEAEQAKEWAKNARGKFDNFVLLGIGGSALGPRAIVDCIKHLYHNQLPDSRRIGMRMFVCDNVDPAVLAGILDIVDFKKTVFNVVSKSGGTAEAIAPFMIVRQLLLEKLGPLGPKNHIVFTTDPKKGVLRKLAETEGYHAFDVPPSVGGRYSVLSNVGLLPAAAAGVDPVELLHGAVWADEKCATTDVFENPAAMIAAMFYLFHTEKKKNILVAMPYNNGLLTFAEWFQQLWAESLGKLVDRDGKKAMTGSTPVRALGSTDQHSQLQLYMEGPLDKLAMFMRVETSCVRLTIPDVYQEHPDMAYLGGHSLEELINAEQEATAAALARSGRPCFTLSIARSDTKTLGALFHLFELVTMIAGDLYNVDPFDQPGVELGKKLTYGMMGREGFKREETKPATSWILRNE